MKGRPRFGRSARAAASVDLADRLHPYLVPAGYPDALSTPTQAQRSIGHGLSLALVVPTGAPDAGVVTGVTADALATAGIALPAAYSHAERNLLRALGEQRIDLRTFERGPSGHPFVVATRHWLAATVLTAPGLFERLAAHLGDDVVVAVPDRSLLLAYAAAATSAMQDLVEEEYRNAPKPLTSGLFSMASGGPVPIA